MGSELESVHRQCIAAERRGTIKIQFPTGPKVARFYRVGDGVRLNFDSEANVTVYRGYVKVRASACSMWTQYYPKWATEWIDAVSLLSGTDSRTLGEATAAGWKVTALELCADFVNLSFSEADLANFVRGGRDRRIIRGDIAKAQVGAGLETIEIGTRTRGTLSCETHNKTLLLHRKNTSRESSPYDFTWTANDAEDNAVVRRVEFRASGSALNLQAEGRALDLRDPVSLATQQNLDAFWTHASNVIRLVEAGRTRPRRGKIDPRWRVVQGAALYRPKVGRATAPPPVHMDPILRVAREFVRHLELHEPLLSQEVMAKRMGTLKEYADDLLSRAMQRRIDRG